VPICPGVKKTSAGNSTQLPAQLSSAHAATSGRSPELPDISPEVDSPRSQNPGAQNLVPAGQLLPLSSPVPASVLWSWRRDLNPRPSDYKSDALPAELRQLFNHPETLPEPDSCADTLQLSAYTAQKSRLAHHRTTSKRSKPLNPIRNTRPESHPATPENLASIIEANRSRLCCTTVQIRMRVALILQQLYCENNAPQWMILF
jgi:hypothetical protein